ncbi:MAG: hypothetical protein ACI89L_001883 [Phycisphaerales bacterium]|jgi:hypothetical protein
MPTPPANTLNTPPGQDPPGPREPDTGRTFTQKLGIFLTGVAIGLMFLGWTQYRKGAAARQIRDKQAIEQREAAEALPDPTPESDAVPEPGSSPESAAVTEPPAPDDRPDTEPTADPH